MQFLKQFSAKSRTITRYIPVCPGKPRLLPFKGIVKGIYPGVCGIVLSDNEMLYIVIV